MYAADTSKLLREPGRRLGWPERWHRRQEEVSMSCPFGSGAERIARVEDGSDLWLEHQAESVTGMREKTRNRFGKGNCK